MQGSRARGRWATTDADARQIRHENESETRHHQKGLHFALCHEMGSILWNDFCGRADVTASIGHHLSIARTGGRPPEEMRRKSEGKSEGGGREGTEECDTKATRA